MKVLKDYQEAIQNLRKSLGITEICPFDDFTNYVYTMCTGGNELWWAIDENHMEIECCYNLEFKHKKENKELIAFYDHNNRTYVLFKKSNQTK